ncbi:hypothetical protein ACU686_11740 [Yinghuangia aomiensis]
MFGVVATAISGHTCYRMYQAVDSPEKYRFGFMMSAFVQLAVVGVGLRSEVGRCGGNQRRLHRAYGRIHHDVHGKARRARRQRNGNAAGGCSAVNSADLLCAVDALMVVRWELRDGAGVVDIR